MEFRSFEKTKPRFVHTDSEVHVNLIPDAIATVEMSMWPSQ